MAEDCNIDIDLSVRSEDFPWQIQIIEEGSCACGKNHEKGDAVYGKAAKPDEEDLEDVRDIHSLDVKIVES